MSTVIYLSFDIVNLMWLNGKNKNRERKESAWDDMKDTLRV